MADLYSRWDAYAGTIADNRLTTWKSHPDVTYMLEHEWELAASLYIDYLRPFLSDAQIQAIATKNDLYGGASVKTINKIVASPSSIRYIRHAYDTMDHIRSKNLNDVSIIEVGGGYGGLALAMFQMADIFNIRIKKYIIYDLPGVSKLQQYYLTDHGLNTRVEWRPSALCGSDCDASETNVLVSCYCMSEIPDTYRIQYLSNLLPKIKAAYFVWNWGSKAELPADRDERPEVPDTSNGRGNTVIRL